MQRQYRACPSHVCLLENENETKPKNVNGNIPSWVPKMFVAPLVPQ